MNRHRSHRHAHPITSLTLLLAHNCNSVSPDQQVRGQPQVQRLRKRLYMEPETSLSGHLTYGKNLIHSGVSGLRAGKDSFLKGRSLSAALENCALHSLTLAIVGAFAGLIPLSSGATRKRAARSLAFGAMGCAVGFCGGFAWATRQLTGSMARAAKKSMEAASDQHWLERHPIDYA
jgi:hypothetical protein